MNERAPRVSVIVPTLDGRSLLEGCLGGLQAQTLPADEVEWIVVDNGSADDSLAWLRGAHPRARGVALESNLGFAEANNRGAAQARGTYLALLNNDAVPAPDFLERLLARAAPSGVTAVAARLLDARGETVEFAGGDLNVFGFGSQRSSWHPRFEERAPGSELPFACGGAMLVRRSDFLDLGGFDADYFAYYEDVDFGWRVNLAGGRIVYAPEAQARHARHATSQRFDERWRHFHWFKNVLQTLLKNADAAHLGRLFPATFLLLAARAGTLFGEVARGREQGDLAHAERYLGAALGAAEGLAWVLERLDLVFEKRRHVQARRCVSAAELNQRFGLELDFGADAADWPENTLALKLAHAMDLEGLLRRGQLEAASLDRLRALRAEGDNDALLAKNARLRHEIAALRGSWSWRSLGPLRRLADRLRSLVG